MQIIITLILAILLGGCAISPRVMAQDRLFLPISLEFLGEYQLPKQEWQGTPVGGLSGLAYNPQTGDFLAISDDRSNLAPARFYTINLQIDADTITEATIKKVTLLKNPQGETYPQGSIDPEGIAISPRKSVYISSEGIPSSKISPFIQEYELENGILKSSLNIPDRYLNKTEPPTGMAENKGFEALSLSPNSLLPDDPFRLFTATESSLLQDYDNQQPQKNSPIRMMHYVINSVGPPILVAEHLYPLEANPYPDTLDNGLTELLALPQEGYFLSLERTFDLSGFGAKIFQLVIANATDINRVVNLTGDLSRIQPIQKKLVMDLSELNIELDNLEGMTFGPPLASGDPSLILVSDDNFREEQVTQFLLFRLKS